MRIENHYYDVKCLDVSKVVDANNFITGYGDGTCAAWDPTTLQMLVKCKPHRGSVNAIAFSPKVPRLAISGGADGDIHLLDIGSKSAPNLVKATGSLSSLGEASSVAFHHNGINCAVGTSMGKICLYDLRNCQNPLETIDNSEGNVYPVYGLLYQVSPLKK